MDTPRRTRSHNTRVSGQVEAREAHRVGQRESQDQGAAAGEQPHLIAVPHRADGRQHRAPFVVGTAPQQVQRAGAEIETVQDHVDGKHDGHQPNQRASIRPPLGRWVPAPSAPAAAPPPGHAQSLGRRGRGTAGPATRYSPAEAEGGEDGVSGVHQRAACRRGAQQAVDEPGLAAELGGHPAGGVGDVREGEGQHQHPEQPAATLSSCPWHSEQGRQAHERDEERAQARP